MIKDNCDIYITGSNAYMLSGELATLLSGRYIEIKMLPLSFKEYAAYYKNENNTYNDIFNSYINMSSFPFCINFNEEIQFVNYLEDIFNFVIVKDISMRIQKLDITLLNIIAKFMFDTIGGLLSVNKIANTLTSKGYKVDNKTVLKYIKALTDSMLFYKVGRYSVKGKNILSFLEKYYVVDAGIRNIKLGRRYADLGYIIENIAYLELLRRKYEVYVGNIGEMEIDFVALKNGIIEYYQVSLTLMDKNTMEREIKSLQNIHDNYPKYILSLDNIGANRDIDGIKHINLINWLLEN